MNRVEPAAPTRSPSAHEAALDGRGVRKELGAYYTPADVVDGLLDLTLTPILDRVAADGVEAVAAVRVLDPACGTGHFLVAAAGRIAARLRVLGVDGPAAMATAVRCVRGVELDDGTARACRANLRALGGVAIARQVVRGDSLLDPALVRAGSFDLVIGNPPFLSQLATTTARAPEATTALRSRFGGAISAYTDPAALFLLAALEAARPEGGVVCLVEPVALLSSRDARTVRQRALAAADLQGLWVAKDRIFDADVEVCAPILVRGADGGSSGRTELVRGRSFDRVATTSAPSSTDDSWSSLLAAAQDIPERELRTSGLLGDVADATADFRDQYYGLAGAVVDQVDGGPDEPRLITSGLIDPARLAWGDRSCRFNKVSYAHPRIQVDALSEPLRAWAERRLVPKVLVATQTKVLEAVVDEDGDLLPSVPVITITAPVGDLWRIGALLCSPPITLLAARRHLGSGRNATALRLTATDVLALPLPADRSAWDRAAQAFAAASAATGDLEHEALLAESATAMLEAYGLAGDEELLAWWAMRLPHRVAGPKAVATSRS